ncbi:MAG: DNA cytosine methyltransferase [Malacoplasma sp.]|nr:DNA cytosine methyltransferase [Malacoplasma sp.]
MTIYIYINNFLTTNWNKTKNGIISKKIISYSKFNSENYIYSIEAIGPTLTASGANSRIKIATDKGIRYLTPQECYLYMGFDNTDYQRVKNTQLLSNNKIIYTAGNSIPICILESIFAALEFED